MNGSLGAAGRGRGAGMPYPTPAMQGATSSVLAETLTQVSPQMASHAGLSTAQAGGMSKVSERQCSAGVLVTGGTFLPLLLERDGFGVLCPSSQHMDPCCVFKVETVEEASGRLACTSDG